MYLQCVLVSLGIVSQVWMKPGGLELIISVNYIVP